VKNNLDSIEISKKEKDRSGSSDTKNGQETSPQFESIKALSDIAKSGLDTNFDTDELQNNSFEKQEQMLGGGKGIKCLRNKRAKKHHPKKGQQRSNKHEEDKIPSGDDFVQL
jgi:hypothetical protein